MTRKLVGTILMVAVLVGSMFALMPVAQANEIPDNYTITVPIPGTPCSYTINAGFDTQGTPPAYANGTLTCSG